MDHSMKPAAALSAFSSRRWVLATSLCSLACLFLLSAGLLLLAAGYRPFLPHTAAPWDRLSRMRQQAAPSTARASHDAAVAPAPAPDAGSPGGLDLGQEDEEEDAGPPSPAPAPAEEEGEGGGDGECDVFDGTWVRDDAAWYPLYEAAECPFLSDQVACRRNGRPDSGYEQWRWRPRGCGGRARSVRTAPRSACIRLRCTLRAMATLTLVSRSTSEGWAARRPWSCAGTSGSCSWATR